MLLQLVRAIMRERILCKKLGTWRKRRGTSVIRVKRNFQHGKQVYYQRLSGPLNVPHYYFDFKVYAKCG